MGKGSTSSKAITLVIVGETNIQDRADPGSAFAEVREMFDAADLRFCHLEGPLCEPSQDPAKPDIPHKLNWRHSDPRMVQALLDAGIDAVSCASNVSYPTSAALRSSQVLSEAGIAFCGVGKDLAAARAPAIVEKNGVRIGFFSFTSVFWPSNHAALDYAPGTSVIKARTAYEPGRRALEMPGAPPEVVTWVDEDEIATFQSSIRDLAARVDVVIASCHWGVSSSSEPVAYQRQLGRAAIDAGADMVIGHHPHVLQPIEYYQGKPIFFSLGNFAFDWPKMRNRHTDGILLTLSIADSEIETIKITPAFRGPDNQSRPVDADSMDGKRILGGLAELSGPAIALQRSGQAVTLTQVVAWDAHRTAAQ